MDLHFLQAALLEAATRRGFCAPNPAVGAVIVKDGRVLAAACHHAAGADHAEVAALKQASESVVAATIYVTLEPCCHYGRTPPCAKAIIEAGLARVVYAHADPNPVVAGGGAEMLRAAGVQCEQVMVPEIEAFYRSYDHWTAHKLPWVTAKLALSADDKIAGPGGVPVAITGQEAKVYTHQGRLRSDALLTTAKTVQQDDPQLNVRLDGDVIAKPVYILDRRAELNFDYQIFKTAERITVFYDENIKPSPSSQDNIKKIPVPCQNGQLDLATVLKIIGEDGIQDLWVEAGGRCFQSFHELGRLHRALIYRSPKRLGPSAQAAFDAPMDFTKGCVHHDRLQLGEDTVFIFDYDGDHIAKDGGS